MSNITIVNHLFVPLRYLQFLKIIRSTAAAAENEPCKVCPLSAYRSPRYALEQQRAAAGKIQKAISEKKKATKGKDPCTEELKQKAEAEKAIAGLETSAQELEEKRDAILWKIGNVVDPTVPMFKDEDQNATLRTWGQPRLIKPDGKTPGRLHHYQVRLREM